MGTALVGRAQSMLETAELENFSTDNGRCVLANDSVYTGKMEFKPEGSLPTITHLNIFPNGKKVKLRTYEVKSFTIDQRYFIATNYSGMPPTRKDWLDGKGGFFVQLTDTGRLWMARRYLARKGGASGGGIGMMVGGGGMMPGAFISAATIYPWLLRHRKSGLWQEIPIPGNGKGTNKKFRQMLAPYFADRPDLLQSLEGEALDYKRVDQAIRGYNSGEPVFFIDHDY